MEADTLAILKSLADETRLSIVRRLAHGDCQVAGRELVSGCSSALQLTQPTMSHHFHKLVAAGVIAEQKQGTEKRYQLNREALRAAGINVDKL